MKERRKAVFACSFFSLSRLGNSAFFQAVDRYSQRRCVVGECFDNLWNRSEKDELDNLLSVSLYFIPVVNDVSQAITNSPSLSEEGWLSLNIWFVFLVTERDVFLSSGIYRVKSVLAHWCCLMSSSFEPCPVNLCGRYYIFIYYGVLWHKCQVIFW